MKEFWGDFAKELSEKLWLPKVKKDPEKGEYKFEDLGSSKCFEYEYIPDRKNILKFQDNTWDNMDKIGSCIHLSDTVEISRKFKFYPNKKQKDLIDKCMGTTRLFYNNAVGYINDKFKKGEKVSITLPKIRPAVMKSDEQLEGTGEAWQIAIPYDVRQLAIKEAVIAFKSSIGRNKIDGKPFKVKFKSKKQRSAICKVNKNAIIIKNGEIRIFVKRLKEHSKLRFRKRVRDKLPDKVNHDATIYRKDGSYYLILMDEIETHPTKPPENCVIALDPGVRTFQTCYDPDGRIYKFGDQRKKHILRINKRIDKIASSLSKDNGSRRLWGLKRRMLKLQTKKRNVVEDLHNKTASKLAQTYGKIFLPVFGTSKMVKGKKLWKSTNRLMMDWRHYAFQQKLKCLCKKYNSDLYLVDEVLTSKTCGNCGFIKNNLGGSEIFSCENCGLITDRDVNGARNILIRTCTIHRVMTHTL